MDILDAGKTIETLGLPYLRELSTFGALSDEFIVDLLNNGVVKRYAKGEYIARLNQVAAEFQVVLQGKFAFYKHSEESDVLTRYFCAGDQVGFDLMIGLIPHNGIDVATEESLILDISSEQFYDLHVNFPADFGLLMINLARELAREIALLEDVIGKGTGWIAETGT
ncbi:MAG: Crp/Fnr family transcriptional regulator [Gammaproteobacteria bacterium]|nr:Crp/Fnr family transcriptional regulator [Gammaproteobacteria bacterium]MDH3857560.1 Crp/Fnr family transcriptional regulator [Gammaproteobacteria bacterium]